MLDMVELEGLCTSDCTHPQPLLEALLVEIVYQEQYNRLYALERRICIQEPRLDNGPCELVDALLSFCRVVCRSERLHDLEDVRVGSSPGRELDTHCDGHEGEGELVLCEFTGPLVRVELSEGVLDGGQVDAAVRHGLASPLEDVVDEPQGRVEGTDKVACIGNVPWCDEAAAEMRRRRGKRNGIAFARRGRRGDG